MPKILSINSDDLSTSRQNPLKGIWERIQLLDRFTKGFFLSILLLLVITPFVVKNSLVFNPYAAEIPATPPFPPLDTGLVSYWKMDEASWINDCLTLTVTDSVAANHGKSCPAGSGPTTTAGKLGNAGNFDGVNDYVSIANESNFDFERTQSFSIFTWIKTSANLNQAIVSKMTTTGAITGYEIVFPAADTTKLQVNMLNTNGTNEIRKRSSIVTNNNIWHLVGFTYNGSSNASGVNIYIDGVLDGGATVISNTLTASILNNVAVNIGARNTSQAFFSGLIDDARIYNRVLTDSEIQQLYTLPPQSSPIPTPTLAPAERVFITKNWVVGNIGGLAGANKKCQTQANLVPLGGTWKAWLSDSTTSAASNITTHNSGPYQLVDGTIVANSWADLTDGTLINRIKKDQFGHLADVNDGGVVVWTNTKSDGSIDSTTNNCSNWTDASFSGAVYGNAGNTYFTDYKWTKFETDNCSTYRPLYCFEQSPIPTPTPTPSPTPSPTPTPIPANGYQRMFVTSTSYNGNFGGASGADNKCQDRATAASLGGTWKAWISDSSSSVSSRLNHSTLPYKLFDGTVIANNWNDLTDGVISSSIKKDEFNTLSTSNTAWSGTSINGSALSTNCNNWTSASSDISVTTGGYGLISNTDKNWTDFSNTRCDNVNKLYCVEQTISTAPLILNPKRVFVSDGTYGANLGGLSGADQKCTDRALAAGLGGFWKAWLSDSTTSVASRMSHSTIPYKLVNGTTIANDWNDLVDGSIQNPIKVTEKNNTLTFNSSVWTGSNRYGQISSPAGDPAYKCFDWTQQNGLSSGGNVFSTDYSWTEAAGGNCLSSSVRLYCFEQ